MTSTPITVARRSLLSLYYYIKGVSTRKRGRGHAMLYTAKRKMYLKIVATTNGRGHCDINMNTWIKCAKCTRAYVHTCKLWRWRSFKKSRLLKKLKSKRSEESSIKGFSYTAEEK